MSADTQPDQAKLHGPWTLFVCPSCGRNTTDSDFIDCECPVDEWVEVTAVSREALETGLVAGVEVAGKVRDANQAERRRLEAENERLRSLILKADAASDPERAIATLANLVRSLPSDGERGTS